MRNEQLEAWVLSIIDLVSSRGKVEDSRVELKADWPEPQNAARRIAGLANAAGSDHVLWIVGLDEERGVTAISDADLATWLPRVAAEFDGIAPAVRDLVVPSAAGHVVALLFDASRRPFVVKNSVFGIKGGGPVALEVPWRSGTSVRTARRDELLRILVPRQALPLIEVLEAHAEAKSSAPREPGYGDIISDIQRSPHIGWSFHLALYVTPQTPDLLVLPTHKAALRFGIGSEAKQVALAFRFFAPHRGVGTTGGSVLDSSTVTASTGEAVLRGPGLLQARGTHAEPIRTIPDGKLSATLTLSPAGSELLSEVDFHLPRQAGALDGHRWVLKNHEVQW
jgi:hypothetical protein